MPRTVELQLTSQQREFIFYVMEDDTYDEIAYGGARGGNKTFSGALAMILRRLRYPGTRGLALRKTITAATANLIDEFRKIMGPRFLNLPEGTWQYKINDNRIDFANGSQIYLGHCKNEQSYEAYIGLQFTDIWWEEAVQHTKNSMSLVNASCRTDSVIAVQPKKWYTTNPGGPGHAFLLEEFVEPDTRKENHIWIKSTLRDALPTLVNDPGYLDRITKGLSAWKKKQWIDGDWKAMAGQYFNIDPAKTFIEADIKPIYWADWVCGVDYGQAGAFVVLYGVKWQDSNGADHLHVIKEIYRRGLHLDEQADEALGAERNLRAEYNIESDFIYYADPSTNNFKPSASRDEDMTIRQSWGRYGWHVIASARAGRVSGWHRIRQLMKDEVLTISPSGCPMLRKELESAYYDKPDSDDSEDISKNCSDHALDALSYLTRKVFMAGYNTELPDAYSPVPVRRVDL